MENLNLVAVIAVLMAAINILNLYNSAYTAHKNKSAPYKELDDRIEKIEDKLGEMDYTMKELKRDVDKAHEKIRASDGMAKAQNQALYAILIWIKSNSKPGDDMSLIDQAIRAIN